eukprot:1178196-Prorocentrum_minimum.AAC.1
MDTSGELNYCIKLICKVRIDEGSASPYSSLAKSTVDRKDMETPGGCKRHRIPLEKLHIYWSPFSRAQQTAEQVCLAFGRRLDEMHGVTALFPFVTILLGIHAEYSLSPSAIGACYGYILSPLLPSTGLLSFTSDAYCHANVRENGRHPVLHS